MRAGRSAPRGAGDEGVAVEAFAAQRDEELARLDRARVDRDAGELRVRTREAAAGHCRDFREPALHDAAPLRPPR